MNSESIRKYLPWIAALFIILVYIAPLGSYRLMEPDEGRYAEIPREMIETGNYVTPMLNYVKYFEKPAMLYWMNAVSFQVFGQNEFAARFPSALCGLLGILATGLLAASVFGFWPGIIASVVTATSLLYFAISSINITDMPLTFFLTLAMAAFYVGHTKRDRRWYLLFYAAMALGLDCGGRVPRGRRAEDGPVSDRYPLRETVELESVTPCRSAGEVGVRGELHEHGGRVGRPVAVEVP